MDFMFCPQFALPHFQSSPTETVQCECWVNVRLSHVHVTFENVGPPVICHHPVHHSVSPCGCIALSVLTANVLIHELKYWNLFSDLLCTPSIIGTYLSPPRISRSVDRAVIIDFIKGVNVISSDVYHPFAFILHREIASLTITTSD